MESSISVPMDLSLVYGDICSCQSLQEIRESSNADIFALTKGEMIALALHVEQNSDTLPSFVYEKSLHQFRGAVSFVDDVQYLAVAINKYIGINTDYLIESALAVKSKSRLYFDFQQHGITMPKFFTVQGGDNLAEALLSKTESQLSKYIIKADSSTDSKGVYRPTNEDTVHTVVEMLLKFLGTEEFLSSKFTVMLYLEHHCENREYSLEGIIFKRELKMHAVHEKVRMSETYPIHDRLMVSPPVRHIPKEEVLQLLKALTAIVPIDNYTFHLEIRIDQEGRLIPIDLALRSGGGYISDAIHSRFNVDLRYYHLLYSLDLNDRLEKYLNSIKNLNKFTAIGAFYNRSGKSQDSMANSLELIKSSKLIGLLDFDIATNAFSVLDTDSWLMKPDTGLFTVSTKSSKGAIQKIDAVASQTGLSIE